MLHTVKLFSHQLEKRTEIMQYHTICIFYYITNISKISIKHLPTRPYERNLLTDVKASPVIGPVVSSDLRTSKNGERNALGSTSVKSGKMKITLLLS